jgi:hypothetical protein
MPVFTPGVSGNPDGRPRLIETELDRIQAGFAHLDSLCQTVPPPDAVAPDVRRSREYIGQFVERVSPLRAIRLKCGACMGGEIDQMPRGEVAQAVDECGSVTCPLWAFRFGRDPWRELSEVELEQRRRAGQKGRFTGGARHETAERICADWTA